MSESSQSIQESQAFYKMASVWRLRGKPELAIESYRKSLKRNAAFVPACLELSTLLVERGELKLALELCECTIKANTGNRLLEGRVREIKALISAKKSETDSLRQVHLPKGKENVLTEASGKIILLYSDCSGMDGAEQCSHILMKDMVQEGYHVVCVQPFASHTLIEERLCMGIRHIWLEDEDLYTSKGSSTNVALKQDIEKAYDEVQPDLIFFSDGSPFSSLQAKVVAVERGIPFLILTHCVNEEWSKQHSHRLEALKLAFESAEEVVTVSTQNLADLRELFSLPPTKGRVIYNGRPITFFSERNEAARARIRDELGLPEDSVVCVTVARMEVMKGYQYLLAAIERLKDTENWDSMKFVWVGSGTLENRFRSRVAELGLDESVLFLGSRMDIPDILDASDIFLLASQYEGMPLSIIEAMAKGLPVVATKVSGIPEALGNTGALVSDPQKSPSVAVEEIARVVETWVGELKQGNDRLGLDAGVRARKLFSMERMLSSYRELFGELIAKQTNLDGSK